MLSHPSLRNLIVTASFALLLAGCASPTGIKFARPSLQNAALAQTGQAESQPAERERVFVATTRKQSQENPGDFIGERDNQLNYADYSVSIPPNHEVGKIEWPSNRPDPKRHFYVDRYKKLPSTERFLEQLNASLADPAHRSADGSREVVLFIHGYNTDFSEGLYRAAQLKHDYGMKSPLVHFSWPSAGDAGLYVYDRDSVKVSRDHLANLINLLQKSGADRIMLTAHSLGNELLMETLRQLALSNSGHLPSKITDMVLMSPDVDIDVFNSQLAPIKKLPENFAIFVSQKDKALELSSFLTGDQARVGNNIDTDKIQRPGIAIIDVTEFEGGDDLNHFTAATSPSLVNLLKGIAQSGDPALLRKMERTQASESVAEAVVGTATLPVQLVVRTTKAVLGN